MLCNNLLSAGAPVSATASVVEHGEVTHAVSINIANSQVRLALIRLQGRQRNGLESERCRDGDHRLSGRGYNNSVRVVTMSGVGRRQECERRSAK